MSVVAEEDEMKTNTETSSDYFGRPFDAVGDGKEVDASPKPFGDSWRLTPSLMDPNSFAFSAFANQPPGYYTPTPGGFNTLYHSQAGDLHTPGMGMNTPLSMPHSLHSLHAADTTMHLQHFNPQFLHQHHPQLFHDPFGQHHHQHQQQHQQTYAPHQFLQHQDSGYVELDGSPHKTTPQENHMVMAPSVQQGIQTSMAVIPSIPNMPTGGDKFRFHTTLNAPTAMIKHSDEIPVTYLNKGQAYTLSIFDTKAPMMQLSGPVRYRTFVRISFEDEQQRARPGACWQLWKEGRGTNEAHQRGGKLLAVEYVDPNQGGDDAIRKSQVELEHASFDGFAVTWYPNPKNAIGVPDLTLSCRFNFLSTDFSHSKGVKGIPVRLCAKTELLVPQANEANDPEVCFSKVKLFRDHGAERKLSNDVAHVKKTIEKLKQQIAQAEAGLGGSGKRKRSGSTVKPSSSKPGKVLKHKRTWSVDNSDVEVGRSAAEEDLHMKLVSMQDMFSSTRPISVLYLQGEPEDDPDLFPVKLTGGDVVERNIMTRTETWESKASIESPVSNASPTSSSSTQVTPKRKFSELQQSTIVEEADEDSVISSRQRSPRPTKIPKSEASKPDLLALDVDKTYEPPAEPAIKPVACFYVRQKDDGKDYYRAVYLTQRTVHDLVNGISQKFNIDAHRVTSVMHVNAKGLHIIVDEDVVRELPEGQDMLVEFAPGQTGATAVKQEFASNAVTEAMVDGIIDPATTAVSDPLEMWLNY
ncbi:Grainyhead-like protein [Cyphellophora attinorum]|uniref:Grainyhead-like protein n=1 Tax=Cyphellophora attinorum TaxID=1664694 RepID=A0A0N0NNG8_9EURO|nr:Grainyhead-like protein [Phialophora attinorum]KPI41359.1 Grainyhead-like protein [Phialophora attinorum]